MSDQSMHALGSLTLDDSADVLYLCPVEVQDLTQVSSSVGTARRQNRQELTRFGGIRCQHFMSDGIIPSMVSIQDILFSQPVL